EVAKRPGLTHVVIEAPWVATADMSALAARFPHVQFTVRCHSQVAFLQADQNAVRLVREYIGLGEFTHNFAVSANSSRLAEFLRRAYLARCDLLPNLYDDARVARRGVPYPLPNPLRLASFGAVRVL